MRPHPKSAKAKVTRPQSNLSRQAFFAALALCILVFAAYANSLSNGFVWDDHLQIVTNPVVKSGAPLAPIFTTDAHFPNFDPTKQTTVYRPLQMLAYRTIIAVAGVNATVFHLTSILFAIACALAAFWLFWLLTRSIPQAFLAAALFAVHPIHTEAVDWIAALQQSPNDPAAQQLYARLQAATK